MSVNCHITSLPVVTSYILKPVVVFCANHVILIRTMTYELMSKFLSWFLVFNNMERLTKQIAHYIICVDHICEETFSYFILHLQNRAL
jgi:hypothetical protein